MTPEQAVKTCLYFKNLENQDGFSYRFDEIATLIQQQVVEINDLKIECNDRMFQSAADYTLEVTYEFYKSSQP